MLLTNTKTGGWGVEDAAKDAVAKFLPVLVDLIEQHFKCNHHHLSLVQQPLSLNPGCLGLHNVDSLGALLPLLKPFNLLPPALSRDAMSSDPELDQIDKVGEGSLAKQEDVLSRPTGMVNVVNVDGFLGSNEDMTAPKAQEFIAAATLGEVEGHCSLSIRPGLGRDGEAEGGSEGTNNINKWVQVTDGFEKLRTSLVCVVGLTEVNINIGDLVVLEKG